MCSILCHQRSMENLDVDVGYRVLKPIWMLNKNKSKTKLLLFSLALIYTTCTYLCLLGLETVQ